MFEMAHGAMNQGLRIKLHDHYLSNDWKLQEI